jgi:hypothetical protein
MLAVERRELIFWLIEKTHRSYSVITGRLLWLLLTSSLLLISLAFIPLVLHSGSGFGSGTIRLMFILGEILSALLLAGSGTLALYGAVFSINPGASFSISGEEIPRQKILAQAHENLVTLRAADRKASLILRWAALLFLVALLPYVFQLSLLVI